MLLRFLQLVVEVEREHDACLDWEADNTIPGVFRGDARFSQMLNDPLDRLLGPLIRPYVGLLRIDANVQKPHAYGISGSLVGKTPPRQGWKRLMEYSPDSLIESTGEIRPREGV